MGETNGEIEERRLPDREKGTAEKTGHEIEGLRLSEPESKSVEETNREIEERRLSDQELRVVLSEPPNLPERRKVTRGPQPYDELIARGQPPAAPGFGKALRLCDPPKYRDFSGRDDR